MNPKKIEYNKENHTMYPGDFEPGDKIRYIGNLEYPEHDRQYQIGRIYTVKMYQVYITLDWCVCEENSTSLINHKHIYKSFELVENESFYKDREIEKIKKDVGWGNW